MTPEHSSPFSILYNEVDFRLESDAFFGQFLEHCQEEEKCKIQHISVVFMTDDALLEMNRQYLDHDYYTDIITFDYSEEAISGELYISIDRVKDNAAQLDQAFDQEVARVMIHGVLHLVGYGDHTDEEKLAMRAREDFYLNLQPNRST